VTTTVVKSLRVLLVGFAFWSALTLAWFLGDGDTTVCYTDSECEVMYDHLWYDSDNEEVIE
jgi:hypothetical protein